MRPSSREKCRGVAALVSLSSRVIAMNNGSNRFRLHAGRLGLSWALVAAVSVAPARGSEVVLHRFVPPPNGAFAAVAGVIRDSAGNLYGTTPYGGRANAGVVYKLDPTGHETVLHSFTGGADGR